MVTQVREDWGYVQILLKPSGRATQDVTFIRDVPTQLISFSSGDPFDDATAVIRFPQISPGDDLSLGQGLDFIRGMANVDLVHIGPGGGKVRTLWEGMVESFDLELSEDGYSVTLTCMGAIYQLNLYVAQPRYYEEPVNAVELVRDIFTKRGFRHFRMHGSLAVQGAGQSTYETRYTGAWEQILTYIQGILSAMVEEDGADAEEVKRWTLMKNDGRQGVLKLRDTTTQHWTVDIRDPGVTLSINRPVADAANVFFGEGTDLAGTKWRNSAFREDPERGFVTEYVPLAYLAEVWPDRADNPDLDLTQVRVERFIDFGQGYTLKTATAIAKELRKSEYVSSVDNVAQFRRPGWLGTITMRSDPAEGHRFEIKAGQNIFVNQFDPFRKNSPAGFLFFIAQAEHRIEDDALVTTLTVDSKARDLIQVLQAQHHIAEGKTPARILQVNRDSSMVDDVDRPWDYDGGSGFMPHSSVPFYADKPASSYFPYDGLASAKSPSGNPKLYVKVNAGAARKGRWTFFKVPVSEHGSIRAVEMAAYRGDGSRAKVKFHLAFYGGEQIGAGIVTASDMPYDGSGPSPFLENAFSRREDVAVNLQTHPSLIIGWGDFDQGAGFWPGLESEDNPRTGLLRDEAEWSYQLARGVNNMIGALYCEAGGTVYFVGRLYRSVDT